MQYSHNQVVSLDLSGVVYIRVVQELQNPAQHVFEGDGGRPICVVVEYAAPIKRKSSAVTFMAEFERSEDDIATAENSRRILLQQEHAIQWIQTAFKINAQVHSIHSTLQGRSQTFPGLLDFPSLSLVVQAVQLPVAANNKQGRDLATDGRK